MADITVVEQPDDSIPVEEEGKAWESALSEVTLAIQSGFSALQNQLRAEMEPLRQSNSELLLANTNLTAQITESNRTLMERLTPPVSQPIVVVETPAEMPLTDTPSLDESEIVPSEAPPEESEPPARRKRRTL